MIAVLRDGRRVLVFEHHSRYSRTWQREVTDHVVTEDGSRIEGWQITRFEDDAPHDVPHDGAQP